MGKLSGALAVALISARMAFAQGAYLFTWHGDSNFFQGSFLVTEEDLQPGHGFTSSIFSGSVRFTRPDGLTVYPASSAYGSFPADGSGLAGLDLSLWLVDDGPSVYVQAFASSGYRSRVYSGHHGGTNPVTWTEGGFWTYRSLAQKWTPTSAPTLNWQCVASSADGTRLAAGEVALGLGNGPIYVSTNSGATWSPTSSPITPWHSLACSADASTLVAVDGYTIYSSTNFGVTWSQFQSPTGAISVYSAASSVDGNRLTALAVGSTFVSNDRGATWTEHPWTQTNVLHSGFVSLACSADGSTLIGGQYYAPICISTNSGLTWAATGSPLLPFGRLACSADATKLSAIGGAGDPLWVSTNSGVVWKLVTPTPGGCASASFTPDGSKLTAVMYDNSIYSSSNSGASWLMICVPSANGPSGAFPRCVAFSADGSKIVETVAAGSIFVWQTTPILSIGLSGGNLLLSWPALSSAEGFRLEQNSYLPMNSYYYFWPPVSPSPTVTNGRNQVIVSPLPSQSFFRLNP